MWWWFHLGAVIGLGGAVAGLVGAVGVDVSVRPRDQLLGQQQRQHAHPVAVERLQAGVPLGIRGRIAVAWARR